MSRTDLGEHCGEAPLCYSTLCSRNEVKYSFITRHKNAYPITLQCQVLGVSRNGYYQYERNQANKPKNPEHQEMLEWVEDIAESSGHTYGSRRMKRALNALGYPVSRDKARKLMREAGIKAGQLRKYDVVKDFVTPKLSCFFPL